MRRLRSEEGSTLLEFSLVLPTIVFLFLGMVDFGLAISQAMTVTEAAHVGALYGTLGGNSTDTAGMQAVATNAAGGLAGFTATATNWCSCTSAGPVVDCSSSCSTSSPIKYVQVQASATVSVLANYSGLPGTIALHGTSVMRVQ